MPSPDPRIRALADRRNKLRCDAVRAESILQAYAIAQTTACRPVVATVAALQHYSMLDDAECGCDVCVEWRNRRDELTKAMRFVPEGHRWSVCACQDCRFVGRIHLN